MNRQIPRSAIFLLLFSLGCAAGVRSQNRQIDSLNRLLKTKREAAVLCELARENIVLENFDQALLLANEALKIASKEGDSLGIVMSHRFRGVVFRRQELTTMSLQEAGFALEIAKRHNYLGEMKLLLNTIGINYVNMARYDKALEYYFQSLVLRENENDQFGISVIYNNIGSVYSHLLNYKSALIYFNKSLTIKRKIKDSIDLESLLINIGLSEIELENITAGVNHINEGFSICDGHCLNSLLMQGEFGLGLAYFKAKEYGKAKLHYYQSLELSSNINDKKYRSLNLIGLSRILISSKEFSGAESCLKQAEALTMKFKYKRILQDCYKELLGMYGFLKDVKNENLYMKKYIYLKDSLMNEQLVANIAMFQSHFDEREHIKNIKTLEENIALKNEAIAKQQLLNVVLGLLAVLFIVTGILIYRLYVLRSRSNKLLDGKVRERTKQLEEGQAQLHEVLREQNNFMENIREEMKSLSATWKGLIQIKEVTSEKEIELMTVKGATDKLDAVINLIARKSELMHRGDGI